MSSFQRRTPAHQPAPPVGTRLSVYNSQLLTSTGVNSLDGGGLAVGTLLLVKEDQHTRYSQILLRYFLAQGVAHGHGVLVASADEAPQELLKKLPSWTKETDKQETTTEQVKDDRMKIAWRYQHLKKIDSSTPNQSTSGVNTFCHRFDLTKVVTEEQLASAPTYCISMDPLTLLSSTTAQQDPYAYLYAEIAQKIDEHYSAITAAGKAASTAPRPILRIAIPSLASPAWPTATPQALFRFLHSLRGLLRYALAVAMITLPAYLYDIAVTAGSSSAWLRRLEHCADLILELRSFTEEERKAMGAVDPATGYHGTLHIRRVAAVNTLLSTSVKYGHPAENLAFRQRRHGLVVETLHLPPEGGVSERRVAPTASQSANKPSPVRLGCSGSGRGGTDPLDF